MSTAGPTTTQAAVPAERALPPADLQLLAEAAEYLERPRFLIRVANQLGRPVEAAFDLLSARKKRMIARAVESALRRGLGVAIRTLGPDPAAAGRVPDPRESRLRRMRHDAATMLTGAAGGLFGWAGLAVELPVTTSLMLRAIAAQAREQGEDLSDPEVRLECLAVFSHGGPSPGDDALESSYLGIRAGLQGAIRQAAEVIARKSAVEIQEILTRGGVPVLARLVASIAARFNVVVTEKAVAESIPVLGAAGGALVNVAFTDHFQHVARHHFTIRRLERLHGEIVVREAYRVLAERLRRADRVEGGRGKSRVGQG